MTNLFFEFLRFSLNECIGWTRVISAEEWRGLLEMAKRQTLVGVMFEGVKRMEGENKPPRDVLLEWFALAERIKASNKKLNEGCIAVTKHFEEHVFYSCILKGQGNAQMYPQPELRVPGDIDVWVWPKDEVAGASKLSVRRRKVVDFIVANVGMQPCFYHHIDYPLLKTTEVEVHFTPTWLHCPGHNRRLQRFFEREAIASFNNKLAIGEGVCAVPSRELNVVFQLIHLQNHLIGEGIGLRQMMDYYYLLTRGNGQRTTDNGQRGTVNGQRSTDNGLWTTVNGQQRSTGNRQRTTDNGSGTDVQEMIERLGLKHFASATMWVLHEVFGLEERLFIVPADKGLGEFLLHEIMLSGNFGQYDERIDRKRQQRLMTRVWFRFVRSLKFYRMCGAEIRWTIPFKLWHYFWRRHWKG